MCFKHLSATYFRPRSQTQFHHHSQQHGATMSSARMNHCRTSGQASNTSATQSSESKEALPKEIHEVGDISEIDSFTTKQLKYLLIKNCIDYKGVTEKEELRSRARQLWIDFNEKKAKRHRKQTIDEQQDDSSYEIEDSQLCKICMEREIDCVLLECGHYFTCVSCGRKLAECPICRQNVVRCVRTFKA